MEPMLIKERVGKEVLSKAAKELFDTMVKVDVDVEREVLTLGGEWHSQGDDLVRDGYKREDVWGVNFYPWNAPAKRIEYVSLINLKPSIAHDKMEITDPDTKQKVKTVIQKLLLDDTETL